MENLNAECIECNEMLSVENHYVTTKYFTPLKVDIFYCDFCHCIREVRFDESHNPFENKG